MKRKEIVYFPRYTALKNAYFYTIQEEQHRDFSFGNSPKINFTGDEIAAVSHGS